MGVVSLPLYVIDKNKEIDIHLWKIEAFIKVIVF